MWFGLLFVGEKWKEGNLENSWSEDEADYPACPDVMS